MPLMMSLRISVVPARAPADQSADRDSGLWRKRDVGGQADEDAEHQPPPQHDLLDVEDLDAGARERVEDR